MHPPPLRLACSERIVDHTAAPKLARWVLQHGRLLAVKLPAAAPVWQLPRDAALSVPRPGTAERPASLLLRTATLQVGARRLRLLVGPGFDPAVLGPRLWSAPRVALACLPLLLLPVTAGTAWWLGVKMARQEAVLAAAAGAGASPLTPAAQSANVVATAAESAASAAFAASAASAASVVSAAQDATLAALARPPVAVEPRQGTVALPPLGPLFSDPGLDATRQRRMAARAARAAAPESLAAAAAAAPLPAVPTRDAAVAAVPTAAFALATRALRTAAEAEQVQVAMRTLLTLTDSPAADPAAGLRRVQRIPVGDDWRVMGGPFGSRAAAERARTLLLARGVKTEVVDVPAAPAVAVSAPS